jgi:hypothetical protein
MESGINMKTSKHYRIDPQRIFDLEEIKKHLAERFATAAEMTGTKVKVPNDTETLEFAIKYAFERLKEEGYIK